MNVALKFVETLGDAVSDALAGPSMQAVMATPRFASSRNVVFLMGPEDRSEPSLVAKVARLGGRDEGLAREASNLLALQRSWPGAECVPHLVAHGVLHGHQILLETAVHGRVMSADFVRRRPSECIDAVIDWLIEHHDSSNVDAEVGGMFPTLIEQPLHRLETLLAGVPEARVLLAIVAKEAEALRTAGLPTVFEHGDLSAPNLLLQADGHAGVLDWELANPHGLPAVDAYFFLAFAANAIRRAREPREYVDAFAGAFFGRDAWARPHIFRYAAAIGLPADTLTALFLLCWTRYLAAVPVRQAWAVGGNVDRLPADEITQDKYWHLWKYAVEHVDEFSCRA